MEYSVIALLLLSGFLVYNEISELKKVVKNQDERINQLAKLTGHEELSSKMVSDEFKEQLIQLKQDGKEVEAIKKIREQTQMNLVEAKQYFDDLK